MTRDLGKLGEHSFSFWCSQVGFSCNPSSSTDSTGWDYYIEDTKLPRTSSLNLHKGVLEAKVQIKSTDGDKKSRQISLSNLKRLATYPLPAFFVFIEFGGEITPQAAYLVHVDKDKIKEILRRVHEAEMGSEEPKLNKKTMTISYSSKDEMSSLEGAELIRLIESHVGTDIEKYIEEKRNYLSQVGYEEGAGKFKMTAGGEDAIERLVDLSVGLVESAPIKDATAYLERFGIEDQKIKFGAGPAVMTMPGLKPDSQAKLKFHESNGTFLAEFDAEIYISSFNRVFPERFAKVRIKSNFFDIVFNPYTGEITFKYDLSKVNGNLVDVAKALKVLTKAYGEGDLELKILSPDWPVMEAVVPAIEPAGTLSYEYDLVSKLLKILALVEQDPNQEITLDRLYGASREIQEAYQTLVINHVELGFQAEHLPEDKEIVLFLPVLVDLGGWGICCLVIANGEISPGQQGAGHSFKSKSVKNHQAFLYHPGEDDIPAIIKQRADIFKESLPRESNVLCLLPVAKSQIE